MRRRQSIRSQTLLLTGVSFLLRGMGLLFQLYLSGRIGADGLGLLQLILSAGGFAMTLGVSGARVAALRLCAEEYGKERGNVRGALLHVLLYGMVCSALAAAALFASAQFIASSWLRDARAVLPLRLLALFLPANTACSILGAAFTACAGARLLALSELCERLFSLALTLLLLRVAGSDLSRVCCAVLLGSGSAAAVSAICLLAIFLRRHPRTALPQQHMTGRLLRLTAPLAVSDYLRSGLGTLEQLLIPWGLAQSADADSAMHIYGTVCGMVFPVLMFPVAALYVLADLLVPELARARGRGDASRIKNLTDRCLRSGAWFSTVCAAAMFALSGVLGTVLFRDERAGELLRLFSPLVVMLYLDAITDGLCKGLGQQLASARYNTLTSFLDVALLLLLLPRLGVLGYYISFLLTHLVNFALSLRRLLGVSGCRFPLRSLCRAVFCGAAAALSCFCFSFAQPLFQLLMQGASFALVWLCLLRLTTRE